MRARSGLKEGMQTLPEISFPFHFAVTIHYTTRVATQSQAISSSMFNLKQEQDHNYYLPHNPTFSLIRSLGYYFTF